MKVGFIGLGNMGKAMARNLLQAGHELKVYNRTRSAGDELASNGARIADSPTDVVQGVEILITMLANDAAVEAMVFGEENQHGALQALERSAVHISMSTISVALSQKLQQAHTNAEQAYLSACVFGRPEMAAAAKLSIVTAGASEQIERCRPLFEAMGQAVSIVGEEPWKANLVKLTGNFMISSMNETLGEAFALMQKSGIEAGHFLDIVNSALFKSPLYENYGTIIATERYEPAGFKLKLGLKDVGLVLEAANAATVPMPLASLIRDHFLSAVARGQGEIDWAGLARVSASNAGLEHHNAL